MKTDGAWLSIEIASILLTYIIAMCCLIGFLLGTANPYTLIEGIFLAIAWWVVSMAIRDYRYKTFHPPDEVKELKSEIPKSK